jgi:cobalt-zinc-cadmium efflux system outer membrane protein
VGPLACFASVAVTTTILCSAGEAVGEPGSSLDVHDYVEAVLRAGLDARVAEAEAAAGRAEGIGVGAWSNPALGWQRESAGSNPADTQDIVSLSWTLALSGRLGLEREAARHGAQAASARRDRARGELRFLAEQRFYGVLGARRRKDVLSVSLSTMRGMASTIAIREKAGDASGYERLRIRLEAAVVEDLMRRATIEERTAQAAALALLGPEMTTLPRFTGSLSDAATADKELIAKQGLDERRGDLRALALEARAAAAAARAGDRGWIPDPTVTAGAQVLRAGQADASRGYVVGLEVPLPLFQRGQGEGARAIARKNLAEMRGAALRRELDARSEALVAEVVERRTRLEIHGKEVLGPAEELRRIANSAYRGGASDLLVLVDAEAAAREAALSSIDLAVDLIEARGKLLLLNGSYDVSGADKP